MEVFSESYHADTPAERFEESIGDGKHVGVCKSTGHGSVLPPYALPPLPLAYTAAAAVFGCRVTRLPIQASMCTALTFIACFEAAKA